MNGSTCVCMLHTDWTKKTCYLFPRTRCVDRQRTASININRMCLCKPHSFSRMSLSHNSLPTEQEILQFCLTTPGWNMHTVFPRYKMTLGDAATFLVVRGSCAKKHNTIERHDLHTKHDVRVSAQARVQSRNKATTRRTRAGKPRTR